MREIVLMFHFTEIEKRNRIARALLPLKIKIKEIEKADYLNPIGYLAGDKELKTAEEPYDGPELEAEMIVLAGMAGNRMDVVLQAIRKAAPIPYKAVLTPTNQYWNVPKLFQELKEEHKLMHQKGEQ